MDYKNRLFNAVFTKAFEPLEILLIFLSLIGIYEMYNGNERNEYAFFSICLLFLGMLYLGRVFSNDDTLSKKHRIVLFGCFLSCLAVGNAWSMSGDTLLYIALAGLLPGIGIFVWSLFDHVNGSFRMGSRLLICITACIYVYMIRNHENWQ